MDKKYPLFEKAVEQRNADWGVSFGPSHKTLRAAELIAKHAEGSEEQKDILLTAMFLAFDARKIEEADSTIATTYGSRVSEIVEDLKISVRDRSYKNAGNDARLIMVALAVGDLEEVKSYIKSIDVLIADWKDLEESEQKEIRSIVNKAISNTQEQSQEYTDFMKGIKSQELSRQLNEGVDFLLSYLKDIERKTNDNILQDRKKAPPSNPRMKF